MTTGRPAEADTSTLIEEIARVDLRVRQLDAAIDFYRDIIGLEVAERGEQRAALAGAGGRVRLTLDSSGVNAPADKVATGLFHTAFRYPDRASLADGLARLVEARYQIGAGDHGVSEALYVDDPDGNGVELYRDRPVHMWPVPAPGERVAMYSVAVDLDDLLSERHADPVDPSVAPDIGHVHLQVSELQNTRRFYVEGLGLDLMHVLAGSAVFVSSNGYHHHVAGNTWNSRGGKPAQPNHAGLERVIFRAPGRAVLEQARRRLSDLGYEVGGGSDELVVRDPDEIELHFSLS